MHQNRLFNRTRIQLAGWYTGVMGIILGLAGLTTYQMLSHAHWQSVEQELASISGTLHDNLESKLRQPAKIEPSVEQTLPGLCLANKNCSFQANQSERHILGIVQQGSFYLRFYDLSGRTIAMLGLQPQGLPDNGTAAGWQTLQDRQGTRYHQVSLRLKTTAGTPWGYMQVGRSLKEYDDHLRFLRLLIGLGLPIAMLLVAIASWWLAGQAMQPVYLSYQQMQQFTADAAHELRTPIAAIRATIESTHGNNSFSIQDAHETLAVVERQNSRLAQLVQDLLLLCRIESVVGRPAEGKNPSGKYQLCCLNELISDLVEGLSVLDIAAPIKLTAQIRVDQPLSVHGDEAQLSRLVSNLVINALQYTPPGGNVTVILERDEHQALIHVQDSGIGIAPEDQSRIFDRFYRVSSDRSRQTGGTGLGLAIAQAIAHRHQGNVTVQSELGHGSTFTVHLAL